MSSHKKKYLLLVILVLIFAAIYWLSRTPLVTLLIASSSQDAVIQSRTLIQEKSDDEYTLKIFNQAGSMSFSSDNKVLALYDDLGNLVDEVVFGDHSLVVDRVQDSTIYLQVPDKDWGGTGYVSGKCERNDRIGEYQIVCEYSGK